MLRFVANGGYQACNGYEEEDEVCGRRVILSHLVFACEVKRMQEEEEKVFFFFLMILLWWDFGDWCVVVWWVWKEVEEAGAINRIGDFA